MLATQPTVYDAGMCSQLDLTFEFRKQHSGEARGCDRSEEVGVGRAVNGRTVVDETVPTVWELRRLRLDRRLPRYKDWKVDTAL